MSEYNFEEECIEWAKEQGMTIPPRNTECWEILFKYWLIHVCGGYES